MDLKLSSDQLIAIPNLNVFHHIHSKIKIKINKNNNQDFCKTRKLFT